MDESNIQKRNIYELENINSFDFIRIVRKIVGWLDGVQHLDWKKGCA